MHIDISIKISDCAYSFCAETLNAKNQHTVIVGPVLQTRQINHQKGSACSGKAGIYTGKIQGL